MSIKGGSIIKNKGAAIDSVLLTIIQIVTYVTNMIVTKLISTSVSLEEYGTYSSVLVIVSLFTSISLLGLGDCTNYFYNNDKVSSSKEEKYSFINTILFIELVIGCIVGVIILVFKSSLATYYSNPIIKPLLIIVCIKPMLENAIHIFQVLFVSVGKARIIAIRNLVISVMKVLIMVVSLKVYSNLSLVFVLLVILDVLQLITFSTYFGKTEFIVKPYKMDIRKIKTIFSYGIPMGIYAILNTLMRDTDKLVVGRLCSTSELAVYTNCSKELPFGLVTTAFATVLVPYIMKNVSNNNTEQTKILFKNYLKLGYLSVWMLGFAVLITSNEMIPFLYSKEYITGVDIFRVYIIDSMLKFASMHLIITAKGEAKYLMTLAAISLGMNMVLNIIFFYVFKSFNHEMLGPAIATIVVSIFYIVLVLRKSLSIIETNLKQIFDLKEVVMYLVQLLCSGFLFWYIKCRLLVFGVTESITLIMVCGMYCAFNFLVRIKEYKMILGKINAFR